MELTLDGRVVPYTRMTQRGKWVSPAAIRYLDNQLALRLDLAREAYREGEDYPVFPKGKRLVLRITFTGNYSRADVSNLLKAVEDAGNHILWADDRQIDEIHVRREPGEYQTRIVVDTL